ncbi:MAG: hypothetical protein II575_02360 [Bacteroidales bacterium]|nr:hypothetical protein [Bacteroidales bacterium]MBQ2056150.1 hypothetical protein [Bacteroidaceae bacterium]MBQ2573037.1 hypothetical protein [Bacteroidales bacterium]
MINKTNGASYSFKAPNIEEDTGKNVEVMFPTFDDIAVTLSSNAGSAAIKRTASIVKLGTENLAAATTLTATPSDELPKGAIIYVLFKCGSTKYDVTVKKNATDTGVTIVGVASSTVCKSVLWDGTNWIVVG